MGWLYWILATAELLSIGSIIIAVGMVVLVAAAIKGDRAGMRHAAGIIVAGFGLGCALIIFKLGLSAVILWFAS